MKIDELNKGVYILLLLFMLAGSVIIGAGFSVTNDSADTSEAIAAASEFDDAVTLCLEAVEETEGEVYDPLEQVREKLDLEIQVEEKGCIVVLTEAKSDISTDDEGDFSTEGSDIRKRYYQLSLSDEQQDKVFELCKEYDLPAELVFGVITADSSLGNSDAREEWIHGVMLPNRQSAEWYMQQNGISDMNDFEQNVLCGIIMLSEYYHRYPNIHKIAMCYELGESAAIELWSSNIIETEYSSLVAKSVNTLILRD